VKALALVVLLALVGCGEVTEVPGELAGDASAPELGQADGGRDAAISETKPDLGGPELAPVSCIVSGCASCTQAGPAGPGFQTAEHCAAVIACVRAGGQGEYPWQSCANMHASSLAAAGVACAQQLDKACP
jgi:hypothetical protein